MNDLPFWIKLALFILGAFLGGRITLKERSPLIKNPIISLSLIIVLIKAGMYYANYDPPKEFFYLLIPSLGVWVAFFVLTYCQSLRNELTGNYEV